MLQLLRAWLNGSKDYFTGVALYEKLGSNDALKKLFVKGPTDFNRKRLHEELLSICNDLKTQENDRNIPAAAGSPGIDTAGRWPDGRLRTDGGRKTEDAHPLPTAPNQPKQPVNVELYNATRLQANKLYKETMNNRAVLFSMADSNDHTDPNTEAKINERVKLALSVVTSFQQASAMYDKSEYVSAHGRLPDQDENGDENEYDHLPDQLVKQTLDNLRKNVNKMKKREQTPERVALQQKHEANIEKLSKKWHSLKH